MGSVNTLQIMEYGAPAWPHIYLSGLVSNKSGHALLLSALLSFSVFFFVSYFLLAKMDPFWLKPVNLYLLLHPFNGVKGLSLHLMSRGSAFIIEV